MQIDVSWWTTLGGYEKIVLQFSHEAREFFPELLDTWEPSKTKKSEKASTLSNEYTGE